MDASSMGTKEPLLPEDFSQRKLIILRELKDRSLWFVRLRWWVPPFILAGTLAARLVGVEFALPQLMLVAALVLVYNILFHMLGRRFPEDLVREEHLCHRFAYWQVALDYAAMFLLIHFTGGAASPLIFFFIFHIIFASILLPPRSAYVFSVLVAAGMGAIALTEYLGWIPHHPLLFQGESINLVRQPFHMMVALGFFAASVFITAFSTTAIMRMLRKRIRDLGELSESVSILNNRLQSLFAVIQAIGSAQRLDRVLPVVTGELRRVMEVKGISVKLLSEDGRFLRYAAACGLPEDLTPGKEVEVQKSPLNRRVIEGDPYVTGQVTAKELFQFGEALAAAKIRSVLFVPLTVDDRVIGILGAYCVRPDRFGTEDVHFFRMAGGLVAIALENARAYEAIEKLIQERSWYMMRVTHNLRAPLAAMLSILEVVRGGYLGELNDQQREHLRRLDRRSRTMLSMINELMTLAENRSEKKELAREPVDPVLIANRIRRTFQDEAAEKRVEFKMVVPEDLPPIQGDAGMLEQMLENLVSNALKYTPSEGCVSVSFTRTKQTLRIEVSDTGIGIPGADRSRLFDDFFRAENAKAVDADGTGLGLAIVKEIVDKHGGRIMVESEEGFGSIFVVNLPMAREEVFARSAGEL
jgi:signal transduction histidine kinase